MSTVVIVKKDNLIIIGADTLTKQSNYINKHADYFVRNSKIVRFGDSFISYVGAANWDLILLDFYNRSKDKPKLNTREQIFKVFTALHVFAKDEHFLLPSDEEDDEFESLHLSCAIANTNGIFGVDNFRWAQEYSKFWAFGSGRDFALGAMKTIYNHQFDAEQIANAGLEAAAEFDDSTGTPFEIYSIKIG